MRKKPRLIIPILGNIIFGYPPQLPERKETILGGEIYDNNKLFIITNQCANNTFNKVKKVFERSGTRSSGKI
jgi:hypothetical protein